MTGAEVDEEQARLHERRASGIMEQMLAQFQSNDMTAQFWQDDVSGQVGLWLAPTALVAHLVPRRPLLDTIETRRLPGPPLAAWAIDPLLQLHLLGDDPPAGFAQGRTLHNSASAQQLRYLDQTAVHDGMGWHVTTSFEHPRGLSCEHHLTYQPDTQAIG